MTLSAGDQLGPYTILDRLGEGGMGEVYRARDTRLGRDVAVKVLPSSVAEDPERLRRFEHEARAAGILNHPNLLAVFDVGTHGSAPYIVTELVEGETLRARLGDGALPLRTAIDCAAAMARGLAAAHEKGIVHRDLKPENVVVTRDGRVKIVDFGLAKLTRPFAQDEGETSGLGTTPGVVLGTVGYLSPEQVRGLPVDHRSDLFSFGAVLHEMLSGRRAFHAETPVETMAAILRDPTPPLPEIVPATVAAIAMRCLEKEADRRYQSAADVAFDLEAIALSGGTSPVPLPPLRRPRVPGVVWSLAAVVLAVAVTRWLSSPVTAAPPSFRPLTFRRGFVSQARFAPDGETVYYSAAWQGTPSETFATRLDSPESRSLGLKSSELLAVSSSGELAVLTGVERKGLFRRSGTLARLPYGEAAPREMAEDAEWADWSPDGRELALVRTVNGRCRLEYPIGRVLYESTGWISDPRVSPDGARVALLDHAGEADDDSGAVVVVDTAGHATVLAGDWLSVHGLVWSGRELWCAGTRRGGQRGVHAVSPSGSVRAITQGPGNCVLADRTRQGRVLIAHGAEGGGIMALAPGESVERDLSWFDWSVLTDLSVDGRSILFHEVGNAGAYAAYLRRTDGSPAVRLADGTSSALSPDGAWALCWKRTPPTRLQLVPTGVGEPRELVLGGRDCDMGRFFPDGRRLLVSCAEPGGAQRLFVHDPSSRTIRAITPPDFRLAGVPVSPDGRLLAALGADGRLQVFPVDGGDGRAVPGLQPGDKPGGWSPDARSLFVYRDSLPVQVFRVELASGRRELWRQLIPPDPSGIRRIGTVLISRDLRAYAYTYQRFLSDLYLVDGLR
jgi:serine/threonine protein kinase